MDFDAFLFCLSVVLVYLTGTMPINQQKKGIVNEPELALKTNFHQLALAGY